MTDVIPFRLDRLPAVRPEDAETITVGMKVRCTVHAGAHIGIVVHQLPDEHWAVAWDRMVDLMALNKQAWESSYTALVLQDGWARTPTANIEPAT